MFPLRGENWSKVGSAWTDFDGRLSNELSLTFRFPEYAFYNESRERRKFHRQSDRIESCSL